MKAVDDISFDLYRGEILSLVGESGCGKTTCARTILGVYRQDGGIVEWKGRSIWDMTRKEKTSFRRDCQMVFQDPYSSLDPECLICDEPVASLDVSIQAQIINLLMELQEKRGLSILMISHDLGIVRHMSSRVAVMYLGEIVELADVKALYEKPLHPYTRVLFSAIPKADPASDWLKNRIRLPKNSAAGRAGKESCQFYERCAYACEKCRREKPPYREAETGHMVRCWKDDF